MATRIRRPRRSFRSRWYQLRTAFHASRASWYQQNAAWWRALATAADPGEDGAR